MMSALERSVVTLCGLTTFLLAAAVGVGAAGTPRRAYHDQCGTAIAACVQQGYRRGFCKREVRRLCTHGSPLCTTPVEPPTVGTTTSTTIPVPPPICVTTTSTTLPSQNGTCLGPAACGLNPSDVSATAASAADLRQRLLGVWYDCKQASNEAPFGGNAAGLEFAEDGQWYFLSSEGGTLVRETGFGQAGTYEIIDTSLMNGAGHFQLNLDLNTGGVFILQWSLARTPQLLLLNNEGVQGALYSHMPGAPACTNE
jgi:hypothetical protein